MPRTGIIAALAAALLTGCGWVILTQTRPDRPAACPAPPQAYEKPVADAGPDQGPTRR